MSSFSIQWHLLISNLLTFILPFLFHFILPQYSSYYDSSSSISIFHNFDSQHYLHSSYNFQPNYAFLTGYSKIVVLVRNIFNNEFHTTVVLLILNKVCFTLSTFELLKISNYLKFSKNKSNSVSLCFLYGPALIFFHSLYSESIYSLLIFTAVRISLEKHNTFICQTKILILLILAGFFRSASIFMTPIIGIKILLQIYQNFRKRIYKKCMVLFIKGFFILILCFIPMIIHLIWGYINLCNNLQTAPIFCHQFIPNVYSYVQQKYWNVSFLAYYKISNIVFILLGLPSLVFSIYSLLFLRLFKKFQSSLMGIILSFCFLIIITFCMTNVQSSTRFLSSHPLFYIYLGQLVHQFRIVRIWMLSYCLIGCMMYTVGFPWT